MKSLKPLCVVDIALAPRNRTCVACIRDDNVNTAGLQYLTGTQYMPVDSIATVLIPKDRNQSALRSVH
jgi:hypothetical protein